MLMININATIQELHEIAKQASILAAGLLNAAPPGTSLHSVQYLHEMAQQLEHACKELEELSQSSTQRGE